MEPTKTKQENKVAIKLLAQLKSNHHNLRAILIKKGETDDVFDSLNWEEGVIDSLITILS